VVSTAEFRVEVDRARCIGAGRCVAVAADIFDQDESDAVVILRVAKPPDEARARVEQAARNCPANAIRIVV
jgi:ferredoxin